MDHYKIISEKWAQIIDLYLDKSKKDFGKILEEEGYGQAQIYREAAEKGHTALIIAKDEELKAEYQRTGGLAGVMGEFKEV